MLRAITAHRSRRVALTCPIVSRPDLTQNCRAGVLTTKLTRITAFHVDDERCGRERVRTYGALSVSSEGAIAMERRSSVDDQKRWTSRAVRGSPPKTSETASTCRRK